MAQNPWEEYQDQPPAQPQPQAQQPQSGGPWNEYAPNYSLDPAQMSETHPVKRMLSSVWDALNPIPGIQEWLSRKENMTAMLDAFHVAATSHGRDMTPDERAVVDKALQTPAPMPEDTTGLMTPAITAGTQIQAGNVAGGLGTLTGAYGVPAILAGLNPEATAQIIRNSAAKNYRSVLLPGAKTFVPLAERTATGLAEEAPVALTRGQLLSRATEEKAAYGAQTGTAYENAPPVTSPRVQEIFDSLEDLRQKHAVVKGTDVVSDKGLNQTIDSLKDTLGALRDPNGEIPAATLDDFKDKLNRGLVNPSGQFRNTAPQSVAQIQKSAAGTIRSILDSDYPTAARINAGYKLWSDTARFLEDARRREIVAQSGVAGGTAGGMEAMVKRMLPRPVREIPQNLMGLFDSVAWNTTSGAVKQLVANALANSDWSTAQKLLLGPAGARRPESLRMEDLVQWAPPAGPAQ